MELLALASGSSGNCFYIEDKKQGVLIDVGISAKRICEGLEKAGKKIQNVKGIFITHEHTDHKRGADVLARKFNIPIYATEKTLNSSLICSENSLLKPIERKGSIKIGSLIIESFSKYHSAADPVSFAITGFGKDRKKKRAAIITDIGKACANVCSEVKDSDFLFIESNYDLKMLKEGPYHPKHKAWICGGEGHLSNNQAGLCVLEHGSSKLRGVILSHLSSTNNFPELALRTFKTLMKERSDFKGFIEVSKRDEPTRIFSI